MTELDMLRRLPGALLRCGYQDALAVRGMPALNPAVAGDAEVLAPMTRTLVTLFYRRGEAGRDEPDAALGPDGRSLADALLRLGILLEHDGRVATGELVALPLYGQLALLPSPRLSPFAYFGQDVSSLLSRISGTAGRALVVPAGPGLLALRAAVGARRVVAVENDPLAIGFAELNAAMNGVADRIEMRRGTLYEPVAGERFDLVIVAAPVSPVPVKAAPSWPGLDGPEVALRLLQGLPGILSDDGLAQMGATWHGSSAGPLFGIDLDAFAREHQLSVVMTVPSRQSLAPGSPLLEALVARSARLGGLDESAVRRVHLEHLAARGASHLYLALMTVSRSAHPGLLISRHYLRPGGSWQR